MSTSTKSIPDYQKQFSARNIKNYIAMALTPFSVNGLSSMLFSTYLTFVYTEYLGVPAALISAVVSVGVVIDAITDFAMGAVMDRVITRYGKAKHWFLISALPMAISMILMFLVPETAGTTLKVAWAFLAYNAFCILNTTVRMPVNAMPSLVSDNTKVRGNMAFAFNITASIATSALGWVVTPLLSIYGENLHAYRIISVVCAAISCVTMLIAGLLLTEQRSKEDWDELNRQYKAFNKTDKNESILTQFKHLLSNKYWVLYLIIALMSGCGITFIFGVMAYWLQFVAGSQSYMATMMTVMNIPTMVGTVLFAFFIQKFSPKKIAIGSLGLTFIFAIIIWIVGAKNMTLLLVLLGIKSFVNGVYSPVSMTIVPDIVEYGEWKTGSRQDGLCNSGVMLANKIMSAIATALVGIILTATGYVGGGEASELAISAINFLFLGLPCITLGIGFVLWFFYKLDAKDVARYHEEIEARHRANAAAAQANDSSAE